MITVEISCGLGNQMFQYAFAKNLQESGKEVCIDLSWYQKYNSHSGYVLNLFPIKIKTINSFGFHRTLPGRALRKFKLMPRYYVFEKGAVVRDYSIKERKNNLYFVGYFQNEFFFHQIRDKLLEDFTFPELKTESSRKAKDYITSRPCPVSVHIRRGDYLNSVNNSVFRSLPLSYYEEAFSILKEKVENPSIIVFSDDPQWAKDNLRLPCETYFHEGNDGISAVEDMALMSLCKHNIIANSSFSWWGAWLNQNPDKIVLGPRKWYLIEDMNRNNDIVPNSWIKIDA